MVVLEGERSNKNSVQQFSVVWHWATQPNSWSCSFLVCKMAILMPTWPASCEWEMHTRSLAELRAQSGSSVSGIHHYYSGKAFCQECSQKRSVHQDKRLPLLSTSNQSKQSNGDKLRVNTYTRGSGVSLMESKNQPESNKPIHTDQSCLFSAALGTFPCNLVWQAALAKCPASNQNLQGLEIICQFLSL